MLVGDKLELAYLAGFFDGEGNVGLFSRPNRFTGYTSRVTIVQTGDRGRLVLSHFKLLLSSYGIESCLGFIEASKRNEAHADCWTLKINSNRGVVKFLRLLIPYLRIKKVEAQDVIRFSTQFYPIGRKSPILSMLLREAHQRRKCS